MNEKIDKVKPIQFIRELCKGKPENEVLEAEENFRNYLLVVKEICDRMELTNNSTEVDEVYNL